MNDIGIVDDNATALAHMRRVLQRAGLRAVRTFSDPHAAVPQLVLAPPAVLVIDYRMPGLDGLEVVGRLQAQRRLQATQVVMLTGDPDLARLRSTAHAAGVVALLPKTLHPQQFTRALQSLLDRSRRAGLADDGSTFQPLAPRREQQSGADSGARTDTAGGITRVLNRIAAISHGGDQDHGEQTARYAGVLAQQLGLDGSQSQQMRAAAPLHDIGLLATPRFPERPAGDREDQDHTRAGHALLQAGETPLLGLAAEIALAHHERWDGLGHPHGLRGTAIPLAARIVAVADALDDALAGSSSCTDTAFAQAVAAITAQAGMRFDPAIVRALLGGLDAVHRICRTARDCG